MQIAACGTKCNFISITAAPRCSVRSNGQQFGRVMMIVMIIFMIVMIIMKMINMKMIIMMIVDLWQSVLVCYCSSLWKSVAVCGIRGATRISVILVVQCKLPPVAVVWVCLSYSSSGAAGDVITS